MWYSFDQRRKDESLSRPWSHPTVLNSGLVDWESRALTTRPFRPLLHIMYKCQVTSPVRRTYQLTCSSLLARLSSGTGTQWTYMLKIVKDTNKEGGVTFICNISLITANKEDFTCRIESQLFFFSSSYRNWT